MKKVFLSIALAMGAMAVSAQTVYQTQTACHPADVKHYDTQTLRDRFVMEKVMVNDQITLTYSMYDRFVFGGADSIDKASRIPYVSWWPEEIPSRREFFKGLDNLERNSWDIDLFLAHTCPIEVNTSLFNYPYKLKDPTEDMLSQYEYHIRENNPGKEYPFLFGHHHNFKWGDKYICLYDQVMSIQKKEGKMVLDRVI